jgi:hypothetical protein
MARPSLGVLLNEGCIEDTLGYPGTLAQHCHGIRRKGRQPVCLHNDRASSRKGRSYLAGTHCQWKIPRNDQATDTNEFFDHSGSAGRTAVRDDISINPGNLFPEPFKEAGCKQDLSLRIGLTFAILGCDDFAKVFLVFD